MHYTVVLQCVLSSFGDERCSRREKEAHTTYGTIVGKLLMKCDPAAGVCVDECVQRS